MSYNWRKVTSRGNSINNPNGAIVSHLSYDSNRNLFVPMTSIQSYESSIANSSAHSGVIFLNTAVAGLETLFRPFAISTAGYNSYLTSFGTPDSSLASGNIPATGVITQSIPVNSTLNPYQNGSDHIWLVNGVPLVSGYHVGKNPNMDWNSVRPVAHRLPLVGTGWGYSQYGHPTPNASGSIYDFKQMGGAFASGYLLNSTSWMTGPIDLRWCEVRKVWGMPGLIMGKLLTTLQTGYHGAASGAIMSIAVWNNNFNETVITPELRVFNYMSSSLPAGTKIFASFNYLVGKWICTGADCS